MEYIILNASAGGASEFYQKIQFANMRSNMDRDYYSDGIYYAWVLGFFWIDFDDVNRIFYLCHINELITHVTDNRNILIKKL